MSDLGFERMLAENNDAVRDAPEFGSDWMPPDRVGSDTYLVTVTRVNSGWKQAEGWTEGWWRPYVRIEAEVSNPALDGQEFSLGFFSTEANRISVCKTACKPLNGGKSVVSRPEIHAAFMGAIGKVLRINVKTISKDDGREFTNCYIKEVVRSVPMVDNTTPPQG